jgi:hypothetical protein
MRTKTVKRHYCEFCSKGMFRAADMTRHELGCTKNPMRICYLCQNADATSDELMALSQVLDKEYNDDPSNEIATEDLERIRTATGNCPACILSVLRLSRLYAFDKFDYKTELVEWIKTQTIERYGSLIRDF